MQQTQKIIGESFLGAMPKDPLLLETDFVRLDKSIIWKLSEFFWKYYSLWEKVYRENFEESLPSGMSESHKPEFIRASVERFVSLARNLQRKGQLPEIVYVYEQGPGTGIFAKGFLDTLQQMAPEIYSKTLLLLSDSSQEILKACGEFLTQHKARIKLYMQDAFEHERKYNGEILFARHSNLWDGWPCRFIQVRQSGLGEVYVRAVTGEKFQKFVQNIEKKGIEFAIVYEPTLWKEFFRSIKLQTRIIPFSTIDSKDNVYLRELQQKSSEHVGRNTLLSDTITGNLSFLTTLMDWEKGGYIEIVDVISQSPRKIYPKKYDGSIGYIIDGGIIATWCKHMKKDYTFEPIRKLNTLVRITKIDEKKNLQQMVKTASLEIFPENNLFTIVDPVPTDTTLAVTCTSKLGIQYTIEYTIALCQRGYGAYPHLPARLMKDEKEIQEITKTLLENNIKEIFVAAGNPPQPLGPYGSAMELLEKMGEDGFPFQHVAVAGYPEGHPQISLELLLEALKKKQTFAKKHAIDMRIVTQFCFDAETIIRWALQMKKEGITLPIAIGVSGPYDSAKLLGFALKCGVGDSLKFLRNKKHFPLHYNPEILLNDIVSHPDFDKTNIVGFHFYTFNNIAGFVAWQQKFLESFSVAKA